MHRLRRAPEAIRATLGIVAVGHLIVALLITADHALPGLPPRVAWLQVAGESFAWPWLHLAAAGGLAVSLATGQGRLAAWIGSVSIMLSWSLLLGMWRLSVVTPPDAEHGSALVGPGFGVVLAVITFVLGLAWLADRD